MVKWLTVVRDAVFVFDPLSNPSRTPRTFPLLSSSVSYSLSPNSSCRAFESCMSIGHVARTEKWWDIACRISVGKGSSVISSVELEKGGMILFATVCIKMVSVYPARREMRTHLLRKEEMMGRPKLAQRQTLSANRGSCTAIIAFGHVRLAGPSIATPGLTARVGTCQGLNWRYDCCDQRYGNGYLGKDVPQIYSRSLITFLRNYGQASPSHRSGTDPCSPAVLSVAVRLRRTSVEVKGRSSTGYG